MRLEFDIHFNKSRLLDLSQLIPEKFRETPVMVDLITELNFLVGSQLSQIEDLLGLLDPNTVRWEYLKHLGSLIGVEFVAADETMVTELRNEIINAVDWYKIKGTYEAMEVVARMVNPTMPVEINDLYTNDYETFVSVPTWFVASYPGENPPGLDSSYYKSPHFEFLITLDNNREDGKWWSFGSVETLYRYINNVKPAHTVPHYIVQTKGDVEDYISNSDGSTTFETVNKVAKFYKTKDTQTPRNLFDDSISFDDSVYFDVQDTTWVNKLSYYQFGTGNDWGSGKLVAIEAIDNTSFTLEAPYVGSPYAPDGKIYFTAADKARILETGRLILNFRPDVAIEGISEVVVYDDDGDAVYISFTEDIPVEEISDYRVNDAIPDIFGE